MEARLGDHPNKTFTEPIRLSRDKNSSLRQSFIQCTKAPLFSEAAERAKRQGFRSRELFEAGHDAMITQPEALAKVLLEACVGVPPLTAPSLRRHQNAGRRFHMSRDGFLV